MKNKLLLCFLLSLCFAPGLAQAFELYCRGPLDLANRTPVGGWQASFEKNALAAGPRGRNLQPGSCAWVDRPVSAQEPAQLVVRDSPAALTVPPDDVHAYVGRSIHYNQYNLALAVFPQFASRADYVFVVDATNALLYGFLLADIVDKQVRYLRIR
jgi:hypothetical protein